MRKIAWLLLLCSFCLGVGKGVHSLKDGFSYRRIQGIDTWVSEEFDEETKAALSQTFFYLGRGRQCFAFESEDHRYVLKMPRTDIYAAPLWAKALPLSDSIKDLLKAKKRRETFVLGSFHLALEELRTQTATIALHFGKSPSRTPLILVDKLGCTHRVLLGKTAFALQYKKPILSKILVAHLQKGEKEKAKKIVDALFDVIYDRAQRGILNKDRSFLKNFGYDGVQAYQIDIGSFYRNPRLTLEEAKWKSLTESIAPVQEWLTDLDPELLAHLNQRLQNPPH
jgi:hypothetical protein